MSWAGVNQSPEGMVRVGIRDEWIYEGVRWKSRCVRYIYILYLKYIFNTCIYAFIVPRHLKWRITTIIIVIHSYISIHSFTYKHTTWSLRTPLIINLVQVLLWHVVKLKYKCKPYTFLNFQNRDNTLLKQSKRLSSDDLVKDPTRSQARTHQTARLCSIQTRRFKAWAVVPWSDQRSNPLYLLHWIDVG